ncbi:MAG TPA: amidase [Alphaproteobacteria bacterium]|nr:amidase [Alphaproteobacteria bacterium]
MTEIQTIAEAAKLFAARKLSPVELTKSCLARIERLNGKLSAFISVTAERALVEAKAAESALMAGKSKGALHGIPIAHKDIYCTKGLATTAHSKVLADHIPTEDAVTVVKLAEAGIVMLGKLATHEFAWGGPSFDLPWPPARNPWNPKHFTGGSSSGTGAAVAAGLILGGTGSDTGGSIRLPAAYCGVAGIKPTYGLCSRRGILPLAYSLDHAGPLAWTVEDCAILLQAMAGHDPSDPASADVPIPDFRAEIETPIKGLRIGFVRHFHETDNPSNDSVKKSLEGAADTFRRLGAEVQDATLAPLEDWHSCGMLIMMTEAYTLHEPWLKSRPQDYGEFMRDRLSLGAFVTAADYIQAQRMRRELCAHFTEKMRSFDLLLSAATPFEAPLIDDMTKMSSFERPSLTFPFNVTGTPTLALRCGFTDAGLPLGMQLSGRPFEDALVLRAGHAYEKATNWSKRRPAIVS